MPGIAFAQEGTRAPIQVELEDIAVQRIILRPSLMKKTAQGGFDPAAVQVTTHFPASRGDCPEETFTHSDSDWGPGEYVLQAGIVGGETAAASYTLTADKFPLRLDLFEVLFATSNAIGQTTTEWSVRIYEGTPDTGGLVAEFSSDDVLLPHLVMPPGTTGTILQFLVDPQDPEQINIDDDGTHGFTIGVRIDQHNEPGTPCIESPNPTNNAFPCTDVSGLDVPSGNWIDLVTGTFCFCGSDWSSFQSLPTLCRPSGDWVIRASVTPQGCTPPTGACCRSNGTCTDEFTADDCDVIGGTYQGDLVQCADVDCPAPTGACCVEVTGDCIDVDAELCALGGGIFNATESCSSIICFPEGACCLPDGSCLDAVDPDVCSAAEGVFQGDGTNCLAADCPQPLGACCLGSGTCVDIIESTCVSFGATWLGMDSVCEPQVCDQDPCEGDLNGDGAVTVDDLLMVIGQWGCSGICDADANQDGTVNVEDLLVVIGGWGGCGG
ncbi:MAG: hypothetical protein CMJ24_04505 [Phycisphaerae bacterium]|nr:hypothetical protein [Phycisphaerae bacterium]